MRTSSCGSDSGNELLSLCARYAGIDLGGLVYGFKGTVEARPFIHFLHKTLNVLSRVPHIY